MGLAVDEVAAPSAEEGGGGGGGGGVKGKGGGDKDKDGPVVCLKGVSVSAWNPPPPQRRMVGDLMYLEVRMFKYLFSTPHVRRVGYVYV